MALDKSIASGKERRKPWYGVKAADRDCRNHGRCDYCTNGRRHADTRRRKDATMKLKEWNSER